MITLYGIPGTATTAAHMVLEEIGTAYTFVEVERDDAGVPLSPPDYLEISPFGKVPALRHNDVEMTESAAICVHLAMAFPDHGLLPPAGSAERATMIRHLMTLTNTVQAAYLRWFYPERYTVDPHGAEAVRAAAALELDGLRDHFAGVVGAGPFVLGDAFSVADPYLAMLSSWSTEMAAEHRWWNEPALAAHYDAVLARPGCRSAVEQEGGTLSSSAG
jgi:glutathione S-transferase